MLAATGCHIVNVVMFCLKGEGQVVDASISESVFNVMEACVTGKVYAVHAVHAYV